MIVDPRNGFRTPRVDLASLVAWVPDPTGADYIFGGRAS